MSDQTFTPVELDSAATPAGLFRRRVLTAIAIAAGVVVLLLLLYGTAEVLLLLFVALLIAVALRKTSHLLHEHSPLSEKLALAVVTLLVIGVLLLIGLLIGPRLASEADQLTQALPQSFNQIESQLQQYSWGQQFLQQLPQDPNWSRLFFGQTANIFSRITGIFSTLIAAVANLALVLFTAMFFAIEPRTYINGIAQLVPPASRQRARDVMLAVGDTLAKWLVTRAISMVAIGLLTTIGLLIIGVPLALTLGVIAGLMAFIPMIGPIIALIPALLVGLLQSPQTALWVLALYLVVQSFDNYILTPIVVKQTIRMPPALIITSQLVLGVLFGQLGLILAAPLAAAGMTLTRMVYVHDFLERKTTHEQHGTEQ